MHDNPLNERDLEELMRFQINKTLVDKGKKEVIFMHCLPASKGLEVTGEMFKDKRSVVFEEAENRMHLQKAILRWCLKKTG